MKKKMLLAASLTATLMGTVASAENIGVSMALFDDNFLTVLRHNIQARADELGVEVQMEDAQGDIARQQLATGGGGGPAGRQGSITDQNGCQQRLGGS